MHRNRQKDWKEICLKANRNYLYYVCYLFSLLFISDFPTINLYDFGSYNFFRKKIVLFSHSLWLGRILTFLSYIISNKKGKIKDILAELKSEAKKCLLPPPTSPQENQYCSAGALGQRKGKSPHRHDTIGVICCLALTTMKFNYRLVEKKSWNL